MNIRQFLSKDAEICFKLRSNAFIQKFYDELRPEEVAAAVNAYMPDDYIQMADKMPFFVVEQNSRIIGFFNLKRLDSNTAEIPFIYLDLNSLGKGIGSACIDYIEKWLASNWKEVTTLIVKTLAPKYNSGFYKKVGFALSENTFSEFQGLKIKVLQLSKKLN